MPYLSLIAMDQSLCSFYISLRGYIYYDCLVFVPTVDTLSAGRDNNVSLIPVTGFQVKMNYIYGTKSKNFEKHLNLI